MLLFVDQALYSLVGLSFVVLGVVTLIRYAGFPDLTVDGSFTISVARQFARWSGQAFRVRWR